VKLKDPSFHGGAIHPVLVKSESGYLLNWKPRLRELASAEERKGQRNVVGATPPQANGAADRF
jgi:hypothetical protein